MTKVAEQVLTTWAPLLEPGVVGQTLLLAIEEIIALAKFLKVLLGNSSSSDDVRNIAAVAEATAGSKLIVKKAAVGLQVVSGCFKLLLGLGWC